MTEKMKILIAYDGSDCADKALSDLQRAGLPPDAEAIVISIAETWLPPPSSHQVVEAALGERPADQVSEALALARRAGDVIEAFFPGWKVWTDVHHGSAAEEIVRKAESWGADLIVVGSHNLTVVGRIFLGSISGKVVTDAHCSVRVARKRRKITNDPPRLMIGFDGSKYAEHAVRTVASRRWPQGTEVRLMTAAGPFRELPDETVEANLKMLRGQQDAATEILRLGGLEVSSVIETGDPRKMLIEEAEKWGAECIFVGTRGHSRIERLLLGSVATAVVNRAHCTVEVVRPPH